MPSDPTAEQVELRRKGRQRLIGAVVLALVAVVFVPMLLDPEPRRDRAEPLLAIPPREGVPVIAQAPRTPEPARPAAADAAVPQQAPAAAPAKAASPAPARTVEPKTAELMPPAPRAAATRPETKPAPATPKLEGFAVQVGAFKEGASLAQAREKVAAARLAHYTERLDGASGGLTRLRAGPFPTREAADRAAAELKRAGLDAQVVPLP
jgi:DedD protein